MRGVPRTPRARTAWRRPGRRPRAATAAPRPGSSASHSRMDGASRAAVYLLSSASPAAAPAASHQPGRPVACSRASAQSVRIQNSSSGVSGVIVTAPTPNSNVAFSSVAGNDARAPSRQQILAGLHQQQAAERRRKRRQQPHAERARRRPAPCRPRPTVRPSADGRDSRAPARATKPSNTPRPAPAARRPRPRAAPPSARQAPRERASERHAGQSAAGADRLQGLHPADIGAPVSLLRELVLMRGVARHQLEQEIAATADHVAFAHLRPGRRPSPRTRTAPPPSGSPARRWRRR